MGYLSLNCSQSNELNQRIEKLAFRLSKPFCYGCYIEALSGCCNRCHTDDLMRLVDGVGVEYGIDWVIKHFIDENLSPIDIDQMFEAHVSGCYPETVTVGWMNLDTVTVMKDSDPISWRIAKDEWIDAEVEEGTAFTLNNGNSYYWVHDLEQFLDGKLETEAAG